MNMKLIPASALLLLTTGCGLGTMTSGSTSPVITPATTKSSGIVMGGQQPVGGITLQLYTVGTTGYGSAATPLGPSFKTTAYGNFDLPTFTCPTTGSLTYLVGLGGQPIAATSSSAAVTNTNLGLMAGLGACSTVGSSYIDVNEITTIATVWALSPFMTGITNIGAPTTNAVGIQNAFANINKIADTTNGAVSGPLLPSGAVLPTSTINTLADILEQCVNSGGSDGQSSNGTTTGNGCDKLFFLTGGTSDTISAALYIAQHPATNVTSLNMLRSTSPVFSPALDVNSPPTSWAIVVTHSGSSLSNPQSIATDQQGNVWVANVGNNSVSEFTPLGAAVPAVKAFGENINGPYALAIDQSGNAWVASSSGNAITKIGPLGASNTPYNNVTQLNAPRGIAIDGAGNVWVSNSGNSSVSAFNSSGTPLSGSPYTGGGVTMPLAIAINPK